MNKKLSLVAVSCLGLIVSGAAWAKDNSGRGKGPAPKFTQNVLEFQAMVGVDGIFLGSENDIRGVPGGGRPWVLDEAKGELKDSGELEVEVRGLVIPDACADGDCNPAPFFRALVSCIDGDNAIVNLLTDNGAEVMIGDPLDGNAKIEAMVDLPQPCIAPIIFVTSPNGAWFSVTGVGAIPVNP